MSEVNTSEPDSEVAATGQVKERAMPQNLNSGDMAVSTSPTHPRLTAKALNGSASDIADGTAVGCGVH
jgi:hypothetical protein